MTPVTQARGIGSEKTRAVTSVLLDGVSELRVYLCVHFEAAPLINRLTYLWQVNTQLDARRYLLSKYNLSRLFPADSPLSPPLYPHLICFFHSLAMFHSVSFSFSLPYLFTVSSLQPYSYDTYFSSNVRLFGQCRPRKIGAGGFRFSRSGRSSTLMCGRPCPCAGGASRRGGAGT